MKFSEVVKSNDTNLVVSRRHEAWVVDNDHPYYSNLALSFATKMLHSQDRVRRGTVSASSLGECRRYQQFVYLGMPKLKPDSKSAMKMQNGAFMHLRWQMEGLTEGWLRDAEVPVHHELLRLTGTMDGITYDGSILELKSINSNGFSRVQTFGPLIPHMFQMATYMLCTRRKKGVFIYENKDSQEYKEIVVTQDEVPLLGAQKAAVETWAWIDKHQLFDPLEKCIDKEGWVYASCPFRDRCLSIHTWEDVGDR